MQVTSVFLPATWAERYCLACQDARANAILGSSWSLAEELACLRRLTALYRELFNELCKVSLGSGELIARPESLRSVTPELRQLAAILGPVLAAVRAAVKGGA